MAKIEASVNKYIDNYINNYVKRFRNFVTSNYLVNIGGIACFIAADDYDLTFLLHNLQSYGFEVTISNGRETIDEIQVEYAIKGDSNDEFFEYKIENLVSTIYLSSKTGISVVGILVMQIISQIICMSRTMYKAVILDLDDTIWSGTLVEDGIDTIKQNLYSKEAISVVGFMRFIHALAKELGLYIAICSRNNIGTVLSAIDNLSEHDFPLKGQIDCIVANHNDKSKNIKAIAQKLSILTNACVFIDDNPIVRDEVRQNMPEVFVPDWDNHDDLLTLLLTCCIFDRFELSMKSRNRKRLYAVLQQERAQSYLPHLLVKVCDDIHHIEAMHLYAKSNQFKFSEKKRNYENCKSKFFELYRDNGENLGVCSAITYAENEQNIHILNWAISCRYFEIGLEEYILMYIFAIANNRTITFTFVETGLNEKVVNLIEKYKKLFIKNSIDENICFVPTEQSINDMQLNTNLKEYSNE